MGENESLKPRTEQPERRAEVPTGQPKPPEGQRREERERAAPTPAEINLNLKNLEGSTETQVAVEEATRQLPEGQQKPVQETMEQAAEMGGLGGLMALAERLGKFIENISTVVDQFLKKLGLGGKDKGAEVAEGTPAPDSKPIGESARGVATGAEGSQAGIPQTGESREGTAGIEGLTRNEPLLGREKHIKVNGREMTFQIRTNELIVNGNHYRIKYNGMEAGLKNPTEWRDNGLTITGTVDFGLFSPEQTVTIPTDKAVQFLQTAALGQTFTAEGITFEKVS